MNSIPNNEGKPYTFKTRAGRCLYLMMELQRRAIPIHIIAKELCVTERTAYRYLKILKDANVSITVNRHGSYTIGIPVPPKRKAIRINS